LSQPDKAEVDAKMSCKFIIISSLRMSAWLRRTADSLLKSSMPPLCSGSEPFLENAGRLNLKNFDYCICFLLNLCYGVYIPVEEAAEFAATEAGSGLRHWPPGTNS
jgi:hypothetical protein